MKSYLKFLSRNKLYTAIEAVGLIVSLAFVILIGRSILDQIRIRTQIPAQYNLHLIGNGQGSMEYRQMEQLSALPEVKSSAMFSRWDFTVKINDEQWQTAAMIADPHLLDFAPQEVVSGDLTLFKEGKGLAITESAARKWFPDQNPLDQVIVFSQMDYGTGIEELTREPVVAVVANPTFSFLGDYELLLSSLSNVPVVVQMRETDIRNTHSGILVNVLADMVPGFDVEVFSEKFRKDFVVDTFENWEEKPMALPVKSIFFSETTVYGLRQGKRLYLNVLVILGILLLASALLNYVNLSMAISGQRAKEMAARQLIGASGKSIIMKTVCESLVFTLVCFLLAILMANWVAPVLNSIKPDGLIVPFRISFDARFILISAGLIILMGVLAGLFPALFLASYRPIDIVSGKIRRQRKMGFNRVCIVLQAVMSFVLIAMSLALEAQLRYTLNMDLGASPTKNLYCFYHGRAGSSEGLEEIMRANPQVKRIGRGYGYPTRTGGLNNGPDNTSFCIISCDSIAFDMLGFRILEQWAPLIPGTLLLSEEAREVTKITEDNPDISRVYSPRAGYAVTAIGGVIQNFRRYPINGVDPLRSRGYTGPLLNVVQIDNRSLPYFWIETGEDHAGFERWFKEEVTDFYREKKGIADLFSWSGVRHGYFEDIIARDHEDLQRFVRVVELFGLMTILLSILGLMAMSTWFAGSNAKGIAIRKVFGGTVDSELWRTVRSYMMLTGVACVIGIPIAVILIRRFLESYPERISHYGWIVFVSVLLTLLIAFLSVLWQTLKAAKTNPAVELKKE